MDSYERKKVERLENRIEAQREEREKFKRLQQILLDRLKEIHDAPDRTMMSFWCEPCQADLNAVGIKITRKLKKRLPIAWWVAYCPARHKVIRRVTDRTNDPYYLRSYIVKRDRARYSDDLLTPDHPRFWLLYGHKLGMPWMQ